MVRAQELWQRQARIVRAYVAGSSVATIAEEEGVTEHAVKYALRQAGELREERVTPPPRAPSGRVAVVCLTGSAGEAAIQTYESHTAAVEAASKRCGNRRCVGVHTTVTHDGQRYRVRSLGTSPDGARQQLIAREEELHQHKLERQRRGRAGRGGGTRQAERAASVAAAESFGAGACGATPVPAERDIADQTHGYWKPKRACPVRSKNRRRQFRRQRRKG